METGYQRGRIQDESMLYEQRKHDGTLPLIGVNTFRNPRGEDTSAAPLELARATEEEKKSQLERVREFQEKHAEDAHAALAALQETVRSGGNAFAALMDAARVCSLAAGHRGLLRGRRPVPPQRLTPPATCHPRP